MARIVFVVALLTGAMLWAQEGIPEGTILPLELQTSLRSHKMQVGDVVKARVMQDVPLEGRSKIRSGAMIVGRVSEVIPANEPVLAVRFDKLVEGKRGIPITTSLRALASPRDVEDAQIPTTGPDRGTSEADWVTEQIGGETRYHGSVVTHGREVVGNSVAEGVLVQASSNPHGRCGGETQHNDSPQAMWLFSSDACGIYDLPHLRLLHSGRTDPVGEVRFRSSEGPVNISAGSGMLLTVR